MTRGGQRGPRQRGGYAEGGWVRGPRSRASTLPGGMRPERPSTLYRSPSGPTFYGASTDFEAISRFAREIGMALEAWQEHVLRVWAEAAPRIREAMDRQAAARQQAAAARAVTGVRADGGRVWFAPVGTEPPADGSGWQEVGMISNEGIVLSPASDDHVLNSLVGRGPMSFGFRLTDNGYLSDDANRVNFDEPFPDVDDVRLFDEDRWAPPPTPTEGERVWVGQPRTRCFCQEGCDDDCPGDDGLFRTCSGCRHPRIVPAHDVTLASIDDVLAATANRSENDDASRR